MLPEPIIAAFSFEFISLLRSLRLALPHFGEQCVDQLSVNRRGNQNKTWQPPRRDGGALFGHRKVYPSWPKTAYPMSLWPG
jgi:hypothetical protein